MIDCMTYIHVLMRLGTDRTQELHNVYSAFSATRQWGLRPLFQPPLRVSVCVASPTATLKVLVHSFFCTTYTLYSGHELRPLDQIATSPVGLIPVFC